MTTDKLAGLQAALSAKAELTRLMDEQHNKTRCLEERACALESKEKQLIDAESHEAALRLLDGEESAPPNAKRRKELVSLRSEREPLPAAIELSKERASDLTKKLTEIEQRIAQAAFIYSSVLRRSAAKAFTGGLDSLSSYLVTMAAADALPLALTHHQPVFEAGEATEDFSGGFVAGKFLGGLTHFTRPASLSESAFSKSVAVATVELLSEIQKGTDA